jgi:hypothetical protein
MGSPASKGIFFPDVPGFRKTKCKVAEVSVNDGIHVHGVMVVPKETRTDKHIYTTSSNGRSRSALVAAWSAASRTLISGALPSTALPETHAASRLAMDGK